LLIVVGELWANLVYHDFLGLHGDERTDIFGVPEASLSEPLLERLRSALSEGAGRQGSIAVRVDDDGLTVRVQLSREFPEFAERWAQVRSEDYIPDLEKPHGRGILMISGCCQEGAYDPDNRVLTFLMQH
jgi:hypothetical protein